MDIFTESLKKFISDSNEVVKFKIVKGPKDLETKGNFFSPLYSHQIFGEKEQIFGYVKPLLKFYFCSSTLDTYVEFNYESEISSEKYDGLKSDNIVVILKNVFCQPYTTNIDQFSIQLLKHEKFKPFGQKLRSYNRLCRYTDIKRTFEVYKADMTQPGFRDYHEKMQTFLLWFIDAASFIDVDDDKWEYFIMYEIEKENGTTRYHFVGYATCYRFYAYPDRVRPRISQILILPPYQCQGHCSELIKSIYNVYIGQKEVLDITAETPTPEFQRVRDFVDAKNCLKLDEFKSPVIHERCSIEKMSAALERFKINKRQTRRICEILRLYFTNEVDEEELTAYYSRIRKRIALPLKSYTPRGKRLPAAVNIQTSPEDMDKLIDKLTKECIDEYRKVVMRLKSYRV